MAVRPPRCEGGGTLWASPQTPQHSPQPHSLPNSPSAALPLWLRARAHIKVSAGRELVVKIVFWQGGHTPQKPAAHLQSMQGGWASPGQLQLMDVSHQTAASVRGSSPQECSELTNTHWHSGLLFGGTVYSHKHTTNFFSEWREDKIQITNQEKALHEVTGSHDWNYIA